MGEDVYSTTMTNVALVTGASIGIGRSIAKLGREALGLAANPLLDQLAVLKRKESCP